MESQSRRSRSSGAFTLVELLVAVMVAAMLAALLIPALAGAKADNYRAWCQANMKQIGSGFRLFENDHNDMFPPAAMQGGAKGPLSGTQLSWDSYINRYIGGTNSDMDLLSAVLNIDDSPKLLVCPADNAPPGWDYGGIIGALFGRRSYGMVGTGPGDYLEANPNQPGKSLYDVSKGTTLGVGVYWQAIPIPADFDAGSFKTSIVRDPAGTLLLVEMSQNNNVAANVWPCVSLAVQNPTYGAMLCQADPSAIMPAAGYANGVNLGKFLYQNHGQRFNYLFHDGHVETLTTNATIGTGTLQAPKGMWTVMVGD
jgi:prepilin-type processing-associated H-X9-DG protein